jgi:hypothetical protein
MMRITVDLLRKILSMIINVHSCIFRYSTVHFPQGVMNELYSYRIIDFLAVVLFGSSPTLPPLPSVGSSVADPHYFDAGDADSDPACHFDADSDPFFHFDTDPDPSFQIKAQNLEKCSNRLILAFDLQIGGDPDP